MNRTRYIVRGLFLLLMVLLLLHLNKKTGVNLETIARFKFETLKKVKADSLDNMQRLNLMVDETAKLSERINEDSSHAKESINALIAVVGLFIAFELIFLSIDRRTQNKSQ